MSEFNLPVTSREYKLMLNVDHFSDHKEGVKDFWELVEFLIERKQGQTITPKKGKGLFKLEKRNTRYLDTPNLTLYRNNFILRQREELDYDETTDKYKLTLKYRSADRYDAAHQDLTVEHQDKASFKFEEDIVPPFNSKFSNSISIKSKQPFNFSELSNYFPVLKRLDSPTINDWIIVNNFIAHEVAIKFNRRIIFNRDKQSSDGIKPCLSFWYLVNHLHKLPLVGEFSFDYEAVERNKNDPEITLEEFYIPTVLGAGQLFTALQKQVNWMNPASTTKTAYAYKGF